MYFLPVESRDSTMQSGEATHREDAQSELSSSLHVIKVPQTLKTKQEAQDEQLKQCKAIWHAVDNLS